MSREEKSESESASPIHSFFRTIWHRPELAGHVQVALFAVNDHFLFEVPIDVPPPDVLPAWREGCRRAGLSRLVLETETGTADPVAQGNANCLTAVLLSMLPRLAVLELNYSLLRQAPYIGHVLRPSIVDPDATECNPRFPALRGSRS
jgi:hypothetical protein